MSSSCGSTKYRLVYIAWRDAHSSESWVAVDDLDSEACIVESVGWVLRTGKGGKKGHVTIVQSLDPWGNVDHVLHIPTAMVVQMRQIDLTAAPIKQTRKGKK